MNLMFVGTESGIWEGFIPGIEQGRSTNTKLLKHHNDYKTEKADPFARLL